jgi:hypothetical protein
MTRPMVECFRCVFVMLYNDCIPLQWFYSTSKLTLGHQIVHINHHNYCLYRSSSLQRYAEFRPWLSTQRWRCIAIPKMSATSKWGMRIIELFTQQHMNWIMGLSFLRSSGPMQEGALLGAIHQITSYPLYSKWFSFRSPACCEYNGMQQ